VLRPWPASFRAGVLQSRPRTAESPGCLWPGQSLRGCGDTHPCDPVIPPWVPWAAASECAVAASLSPEAVAAPSDQPFRSLLRRPGLERADKPTSEPEGLREVESPCLTRSGCHGAAQARPQPQPAPGSLLLCTSTVSLLCTARPPPVGQTPGRGGPSSPPCRTAQGRAAPYPVPPSSVPPQWHG